MVRFSWQMTETSNADTIGALLPVPAEQIRMELLPAELYCLMKPFGLRREVCPDRMRWHYGCLPIAADTTGVGPSPG